MRSPREGVAAGVASLLLLASLTACSVTTGATESDSGWRDKVDQTLGAAVSSLGSAAVLLENQENGHLTRNFVVVAMRDALMTVEDEAGKFVAVQPPSSEQPANRQVVAALGKARAVLTSATTAATAGDTASRSAALRQVRKTYANLQDLSEKLGS